MRLGNTGGKAKKLNTIGYKHRKDGLILLVDSREQKPYWVGSECMKLPLIVGDYTTIKLLNRFHVDRKSPGDLYGTIVGGHKRFKEEICRAEKEGIELVVFVESSQFDFINKRFPHGEKLKFPTSGLERMLETYTRKYKLEFVWSDNRKASMEKLLKRLKLEEKNIKQ